MPTKLDTIKAILKTEGLWGFIRRRQTYHHVLFPFFYVWCWLRIKAFRSSDPRELVDFIFRLGFGFFDPIQLKSEIISLLECVKATKPRLILEIGTAKGGSLFLFSRIAETQAEIISLDLDSADGKFGGGYSRWKMPLYKSFARRPQRIHLLRHDSHQPRTKAAVEKMLRGRRLDFLFIDADHRYEGVKQDFEMYAPLVRPGGLVAFHDIVTYNETDQYGVERFWNETKRGNFEEFVENRHSRLYGIGLLTLPD